MWLVQDHDRLSDGIDYFRLFTEYGKAMEYYKTLIISNSLEISFEFYEEVDESITQDNLLDYILEELNKSTDNHSVFLASGNYLSFMRIEPDGPYSRSRP